MAIAEDDRLMDEALSLAQRAAGRTSPNPLVGALVVSGDRVVGRGFHRVAGEAHAEVVALREAGEEARGATMYVNLEPCAHIGRTGPCTEAIVAAGVRRVVAAMVDPDPQVEGCGIARLRAAGIAVDVGVREAAARRVNEFYVKHRRTGLPFVTLKWAMSLDGKISVDRGVPTAITGEEARRFAHELRNTYDAVLVGVQTVLTDDPLLTCRLPSGRDPLRVILDSRLRTPATARAVTVGSSAKTLVVTTAGAPHDRLAALRGAGTEVLVQDHEQGRVRLRPLLQELAQRGVLSVLIEGGGTVNASALAEGVIDKVIALIAPRLIGGEHAPTPVGGAALLERDGAVRLHKTRILTLGEDLAVEGYMPADVHRAH